MLRPQLRKLRPREMRSICHWAIELAVVVVGVLLALWASERADSRRQAEVDARIMEEVRSEVRENLRSISYLEAQRACLMQSMEGIKNALLSGGDWEAYEDGRSDRREGLFADTIRMWAQLMSRDQFQRALEEGTIERLPEASILRGAYAGFDKVSQSQLEFIAGVGELRPLSEPITLTSSDRLHFLQSLARLDESLGIIGQIGPGIYTTVPVEYRTLPEAEREEFVRAMANLRSYQGACVIDVDPGTGKPR